MSNSKEERPVDKCEITCVAAHGSENSRSSEDLYSSFGRVNLKNSSVMCTYSGDLGLPGTFRESIPEVGVKTTSKGPSLGVSSCSLLMV